MKNVEMYKNMKRKGDVVVRGEAGVKEVENEEQMRKLIENVEEIKKKIEEFCNRKSNQMEITEIYCRPCFRFCISYYESYWHFNTCRSGLYHCFVFIGAISS